jgi:TolB-like protein/Tfp pilus assembly protein PilF
MRSTSYFQRLMAELMRRHVFRVACAYAVGAYIVVQVANNFFPPLHVPDWATSLVAGLALLGFPVAIVLAWVFDVTPAGVQRTEAEPQDVTVKVPVRRLAYLGAGAMIALTTFGGYSAYRSIGEARANATSLAVLPFGNLSADPENEYFSDGMTEDVLGQLSHVRRLKLISRTSVMMYKHSRKPVREIAKELGVTHVLEGSVRRTRNHVRVSAKLIDARTDELLWSEDYDRAITDIIALQSEIAREIARKLNTRLTMSERARFAAAKDQTIAPEAYEAYLRGVYHADEGRQAEAVSAFEMATAIDPNYAPAYVGIARNSFFLGFYGQQDPRLAFAKMRVAAMRALEIDEASADALATMGLYYAHYDRDWAKAEESFKKALDLSPSNAQVHHDYAHFLLALGRNAESADESRTAALLDPGNSMLTACAGWHGFTNGDYDEAVARSLKALMMMPDMFWPEMILGWAYEQTGRTREAVAIFRKAAEHSNGSALSMAALAHALGSARRVSEARVVLDDLTRKAQQGYVSPYDFAIVYASLGENARALDYLEQAKADRAGYLVHAGWDPRLASLHNEPRFDVLLVSLGLPKQSINKPRPAARPAKTLM